MQENLNPPRGPRAALMESERRMLAAHKRVVTSLLSPVFINGDQVVIHWAFEFTRPDDSVMRIEELAHQTWRGDRIAAGTVLLRSGADARLKADFAELKRNAPELTRSSDAGPSSRRR